MVSLAALFFSKPMEADDAHEPNAGLSANAAIAHILFAL